ncbi:helix-turn-helix domain-containing protein [Nonomuraea africana]|uniref:DNA-binding transcriptional ArsR family regulator n=1 Tax=Nonomuraea africana TaxID=46171 RepID=A0ABR9K8K6_9ACTN|nr:helix-turn-helix domain-containing protein [Nonomuraea africana]MBE1558346.1 DNA-binding transcriptional ArsR family regulator [Nonomuraea africana]
MGKPATALHPTREQIQLVEVLAALGHPVRAQIVRTLSAQPPGTEMFCGSVLPDVPKSTLTNHWRVLREAGVIVQRPEGRKLFITLRRDDLDVRFPGLLDLVVQESHAM